MQLILIIFYLTQYIQGSNMGSTEYCGDNLFLSYQFRN